jgi:hypothetical protein
VIRFSSQMISPIALSPELESSVTKQHREEKKRGEEEEKREERREGSKEKFSGKVGNFSENSPGAGIFQERSYKVSSLVSQNGVYA